MGVPHYFTLRELLEARLIDEATELVRLANRAIPANIMLATPDGPADLEVAIDNVHVMRPEKTNWISHSNHCVHPDLASINEGFPELIQSHGRKRRIDCLLASTRGTDEELKAALSDHEGYPTSFAAMQMMIRRKASGSPCLPSSLSQLSVGCWFLGEHHAIMRSKRTDLRKPPRKSPSVHVRVQTKQKKKHGAAAGSPCLASAVTSNISVRRILMKKIRPGSAMALVLTAAVTFVSQAAAGESAGMPASAIESPEIAHELAVTAKRFMNTLDPGMQAKYLFQDAERANFHFFPIVRRGVPLKDLENGQRQLGYALMSATLSHVGNQKALSIMSLGDYLRETDDTPNVYRDSDQYYFTVFGDPTPKGTWGYRVEGFHLSLNVTVVAGRWISVTPSFFGVIPATVPDGPRKGLQVLQQETELARALAGSMSAAQRETGFGEIPDFLTETVGGLITANKRRIERRKPRGLPASEMTAAQREILMELVHEHITRLRQEFADQDLARIDRAGTEKVYFLWAGELEPGEPHHYLIQGPTFLIEYDNTQDDANHVHCVYRDFYNDFGDAMFEHYRRHHSHGNNQ